MMTEDGMPDSPAKAPSKLPPGALHTTSTTSIQSLPEELLILIFSQDLAKREDHLAHILMITSVCHLWRSIALTCPTLWTNITYLEDNHPTAPCDFNITISRLNSFLFRSGTASLSITLHFLHQPCRAADVKAILAPHFHRSRFLSITFNTDHTNVLPFLPIPSRLERLERLSFVVIPLRAQRWDLENPSASAHLARNPMQHPESTKKLRSLHLSPGCFIPYGLSISALEHVALLGHTEPIRPILELLADATVLTSLTIADAFAWENFKCWNVTLPSLQSLSLPRYDVACAINAPALKHVTLNGFDSRRSSFQTAPTARYPCIENIECCFCNMTSEWMLAFLRAHPTVKNLSVYHSTRESDITFIQLILPNLLERFTFDRRQLTLARVLFGRMRPSPLLLANIDRDPLLPILESLDLVSGFDSLYDPPAGVDDGPDVTRLNGIGHTGRPHLQVQAEKRTQISESSMSTYSSFMDLQEVWGHGRFESGIR
ncbi:hypothetical protein DL93DRAFT_821910 [Clavulina sp. PMI_390]|nr:hypothetical protein DL93DRAFT_821910 [Clavulina sp. PMI_390]